MSIDINNLKLNKPYIRAHIAKNGTTNFSNLIKENKKSKVKKKPTLDIVAFNNKMQKNLTAKIKITKEKLVNLANKRANAVKEKLVKKYKINQSRIKILTPIPQKAKRNKWIGTKIDIAI